MAMRAVAAREGDDYVVRVFAGPLRGCHLTLPTLERPAYALGTFERHIVSAILRHARAGDTICDVGAHVGYLTLVMARAVGPNGRVLSFEPDPRNYRALRSNIERNRAEAIVSPVQSAVSNRTGSMKLATFGYSFVSHLATDTTPADAKLLDVSVTTIDELGLDTLQLIKIDVEGAEGDVFQGAERTLTTHRPVVISEVRGVQPSWSAISALMQSLDYRFEVLHGDLGDPSTNGLADVIFLPRR
jgi:FkbM family methyltransferase